MKLRQSHDNQGIKYNEKNPKLSLNNIKKDYKVAQNGNKKDYIIYRQLNDEEKILNTKLVPYTNQFHVISDIKNKSGVYKIEIKEEKKIDIWQTNNFYNRFCRHCNPSTYSRARDIIKQGAIFSVIELEDDRRERFIKESYWSEYYKNKVYELLNDERVLFKFKDKETQNRKKNLINILNKYNIEKHLIDSIINDYFS